MHAILDLCYCPDTFLSCGLPTHPTHPLTNILIFYDALPTACPTYCLPLQVQVTAKLSSCGVFVEWSRALCLWFCSFLRCWTWQPFVLQSMLCGCVATNQRCISKTVCLEPDLAWWHRNGNTLVPAQDWGCLRFSGIRPEGFDAYSRSNALPTDSHDCWDLVCSMVDEHRACNHRSEHTIGAYSKCFVEWLIRCIYRWICHWIK